MDTHKKEKDTHQFPEILNEKNDDIIVREKANLLWRVIERQVEVQTEQLKLNRKKCLSIFLKVPERLFTGNPIEFLDTLYLVLRPDRVLSEPDNFCNRIIRDFNSEMKYLGGKNETFSHDILFQTIELLSLSTRKRAETIVKNMAMNQNNSINVVDCEKIIRHFRVYNIISSRVENLLDIQELMDQKIDIINEIGRSYPEITFSVIESMFNTLIAQRLLSQKINCETLFLEWVKEYGLKKEDIERISKYIPVETPFSEFNSRYAIGIRLIHRDDDLDKTENFTDTFLLRSLRNFYTSWINKLSVQIPA